MGLFEWLSPRKRRERKAAEKEYWTRALQERLEYERKVEERQRELMRLEDLDVRGMSTNQRAWHEESIRRKRAYLDGLLTTFESDANIAARTVRRRNRNARVQEVNRLQEQTRKNEELARRLQNEFDSEVAPPNRSRSQNAQARAQADMARAQSAWLTSQPSEDWEREVSADPHYTEQEAAERRAWWNEEADRSAERHFGRNQSKTFNLSTVPYGTNKLNKNVSKINAITKNTLDPEQAVYLGVNVTRDGRVTQMFDFNSVKSLLQQPHAVSPVTRAPFTLANVKRVQAAAVKNIIKNI